MHFISIIYSTVLTFEDSTIFNSILVLWIPALHIYYSMSLLFKTSDSDHQLIRISPWTQLRVYSHQESLLVHLVWSGPNTMLIFLGDVFRFHTTLFASKSDILNKTTCVLRSSIYWFILGPFGSRPRPPLQLDLGMVEWSEPECDCCIHTCSKDLH